MAAPKGNQYAKNKGKHEKTKQWEALGESIVTIHAERFNQILSSCDDEKFIDKFLQVLEYFKPKLARTDSKVNHNGALDMAVKIEIVKPEND